MNLSDYVIFPLMFIIWASAGAVKMVFKDKGINTKYIPYVAMGIGAVLAVAMRYTSDILSDYNLWWTIVYGLINGLLAVGVNEMGKSMTNSKGETVSVVGSQSADELWEINIDEEEKDAEEETVNDYNESDVEEVSTGTEDETAQG